MTKGRASTTENYVFNLLKRHGPMLSSDVANRLQRKGFTAAAARKIIQRALPFIKRLRGIRFRHNVHFLYLEDQFGKTDFYEKLLVSAVGLNPTRQGQFKTRHF